MFPVRAKVGAPLRISLRSSSSAHLCFVNTHPSPAVPIVSGSASRTSYLWESASQVSVASTCRSSERGSPAGVLSETFVNDRKNPIVRCSLGLAPSCGLRRDPEDDPSARRQRQLGRQLHLALLRVPILERNRVVAGYRRVLGRMARYERRCRRRRSAGSRDGRRSGGGCVLWRSTESCLARGVGV